MQPVLSVREIYKHQVVLLPATRLLMEIYG